MKDPVCKTEVKGKKTAATCVFEGESYYFCAGDCKEKFKKNPKKYVKKSRKVNKS